jgi:mono/diheme cytochrome c family protein
MDKRNAQSREDSHRSLPVAARLADGCWVGSALGKAVRRFLSAGLVVAGLFWVPLRGAVPTAAELEFFEARVRPLLAEHCYQCHSAKANPVFAKLYLDSPQGLRRGSESGPVVVPGKPGESRLIRAVRGELLQMPPTGKLADDQIATLAKWIEMGAPWPREEAEPAAGPASGFDLEARKDAHWAWHPVEAVAPPKVKDNAWPVNEVDRFMLARLEAEGLTPAKEADRATLLRRLSFGLTGLPPTPEQIAGFVNDDEPKAYERLVDRLLASSRFGERWARHWMDLVRYSESHGSEGDPDVPGAWRYRDYLIRALNDDVPYDQLVREHLAGDLLAKPRWSTDGKTNESILGTAHFRMVEHAFQPVEPLEDRVKWTDNQVDVFSKAFQGLTVSCARCHDHKFDAISQKDFYSLYGTFYGARPIQATIDNPKDLNIHREELAALKGRIKDRLADAWVNAAHDLEVRLTYEQDGAIKKALEEAACDEESPLAAWELLRGREGDELASGWERLSSRWREEVDARAKFNAEQFETTWELGGEDYARWLRYGVGMPKSAAGPGEFFVRPSGDQVVSGIYPSGVYTHLLTPKHNGILQSPRFKIEHDSISFRVLGGNVGAVQLIIENYAVPRGGIYNQRFDLTDDEMQWVRWDTTYWKGFTGYIEFATLCDYTHRKRTPAPLFDGRSYFGADRVVFHNNDETPREVALPVRHLLDGEAPSSREELAGRFSEVLVAAVEAWRDGVLTDEQAAYLDYFARRDLLPTSLGQLVSLQPLVAEYRRMEAEVPIPRRAPGLLEEASPDHPLFMRGNHKNPGEAIPRRFLTALGGEPLGDPREVRLHLAEEVANPRNPLTARVAVNRVWRHLFGEGIVRTVDNFGKLGAEPTHPELLDYLADQFIKEGWSIKKMVRLLATSRAYRMSSRPSEKAEAEDPENKLLQHAHIRRLEAETIRDAILAVSGELKPDMFGPSVTTYYAHETGQAKGDKAKGPLDGEGRRSVYLEVRRNLTHPFLEVFDVPKPSTTRGYRDVTNVPAQSLTLMNSPFVIEQAGKWADRIVNGDDAEPRARIGRMFLTALGRAPDADELDTAQTFLGKLATEHNVAAADITRNRQVWRDLAQALFNFKEFIYIR